MKSKIFVSVGIILCMLGTVLAAAGLEPGGEDDPVVTKSYVDNALTKVSGNAFDVLFIEKGKTLLGHAGCEMILRAGEATTLSYVSPEGIENGLQDITDGIDLTGGVNVPINHLIIIPRTDTRGFMTTTDVYVMVKGGYDIIENDSENAQLDESVDESYN